MKTENREQWINWRDFCLGYISAANACAYAYCKNDPKEDSETYDELAFIPAFWNFKHALELGIKFLLVINNHDVLEVHNVIANLKKYKREVGLSDDECKDLQKICDKYCNLHLLGKLMNWKTRSYFPTIKDFKNQLFHYPEGKDNAHKVIFEEDKKFEYHLLSTFNNNESVMRGIMKELKKDTQIFSTILQSHLP